MNVTDKIMENAAFKLNVMGKYSKTQPLLEATREQNEKRRNLL